jgi:hypothetical protein
LAERLGRTLSELLRGSPGHRAISGLELVEWQQLESIRADERKRANRRNKGR